MPTIADNGNLRVGTHQIVSLLRFLPEKPGIYKFLDSSSVVIYVGKAGNLKKRVSSYFNKNQSKKTMAMLNRAVSLEHTVVGSEQEALLLENSLIKSLQPKYNILLKDDKTYPSICIKNEPFPRIFKTRKRINDGSLFFGPYTSGIMINTLLELIHQLYPIRTCNCLLSQKNIDAGKFKVCLDFYIKKCKGPCIGLQSETDYMNNINEIIYILNGHISTVTNQLKMKMTACAKELKFEEANKIKEKIAVLSNYQNKSVVVSSLIKNVDVIGVTQNNDNSYYTFLKIVDGAIIQTYSFTVKSKIDESKEYLLGFVVNELRNKKLSESKEIIVPYKPDIQLENIKYTVPQKGEKNKLMELAMKNAVYYKLNQERKAEIRKPVDKTKMILEKMKNDLNLDALPVHIECFDNSNFMGTNPVAACVVFRNAKPSKKEYRHFLIKTVSGPNDFLSMEEIIYRRYKRMLDEKADLPRLIIVDGGKGQLSSAVRSLQKLGILEKVSIIGIAERLEEIFFPNDSVPLYLDKSSSSLKLIQQLRDEAHRFGITHHRNKRSAEVTKSELDLIKGIGEKTKEILIKEIGSMEKIKDVSEEKLKSLVGPAKTRLILQYLQDNHKK